MPLKLKAGCYYRTRSGGIVGPISQDLNAVGSSYEFFFGARSWASNGREWPVSLCGADLIAKVPDPTKPKARKRKGRKISAVWDSHGKPIEWCSCTKRLPPSDRIVLGWEPTGLNAWCGSFFSDGGFYSVNGTVYAAGGITHWCHVPSRSLPAPAPAGRGKK